MPTQTFSLDELMTLLVTKVGLPPGARTADPDSTFADLGLDSLAFLQLQLELQARYGFELPDDRAGGYTLGEITRYVSDRLGRDGAA
ncbi:MAG TPA: acyl carrier protein [Actinoplanes sp.]|jgi:acyl carrier protein